MLRRTQGTGWQRLASGESREVPSWGRGDAQTELHPWAGAPAGPAGELRRVRLEATATGGVHLASGRISAPQGLGLFFVSSQLSRAWNTTWPEAGAKQISVNELTV